MTDDRSEDLSYENEGGLRSTVTITLKDTKTCTGCGRTVEEKFKWKDEATTDEWKENNLQECSERLTGWRRERFVESYDYKKQNGISRIKAERLKK